MRTGKKLGGKIADHAHILGPIVVDGLYPALDQAVADGVRQGHVEIVDRSPLAGPPCTKKRLSRKEWARASTPAAVRWLFNDDSRFRAGNA